MINATRFDRYHGCFACAFNAFRIKIVHENLGDVIKKNIDYLLLSCSVGWQADAKYCAVLRNKTMQVILPHVQR